ncbi:transposase family protein [Streptomyces djakartensis]|uniref:transposase family protein n=1 Tax=Streptomyces djakartensis TaxID=68193 RepID=UPI00167E823A|nr:transposase family protein [Streptomyces djakartensis]
MHQRRGGKRHRASEAGRKHELVLTDRVLVALVHLRTQLPHPALAELYRVGRSTVTEAIGEIRPLLAGLEEGSADFGAVQGVPGGRSSGRWRRRAAYGG